MAQYCTLFCPNHDQETIESSLRAAGFDVEAVAGRPKWTALIVRAPNGTTVTFNSLDGAGGPEFSQVVRGATAFVNRVHTAAIDSQERVRTLLARCQLALGIVAEPLMDATATRAVYTVAGAVGGLVFNGSAMLDAQQHIVLDSTGRSDTSAMAPASEPDAPNAPPSRRRVARRTLVLMAIGYRGLQEYEIDSSAEEPHRLELLHWLRDMDLSDELEDDERALLGTPVGGLTQEQAIAASWRIEGAAMLAWALGRLDALPHDQQIPPQRVGDALAFLRPGARAALSGAQLLGPRQLHEMSRRIFTIHWRLREFWHVARTPLNLPHVAATSPLGQLMSLRDVPLIDGDLAIGGMPIAEAPTDLVQLCLAITQERHQAINWVVGSEPVYSKVDTPT